MAVINENSFNEITLLVSVREMIFKKLQSQSLNITLFVENARMTVLPLLEYRQHYC